MATRSLCIFLARLLPLPLRSASFCWRPFPLLHPHLAWVRDGTVFQSAQTAGEVNGVFPE